MDDKFDSSPHLTCFSQNHGRNIILLENNTVAYRKASFANAITVSEQPVLPGEIFLVEIEQTEPGWTGHMRLGLTQQHPTSPLPLYSIPDISSRGDSWICAITKYHNDLRARPRTGVTRATTSTGEDRYVAREAIAAPTISTEEDDQPYGDNETGAAPTSSTDEERLYGGRGAAAAPTSSIDEERPYGREVEKAPTSSTDEERLYGGRGGDAAPTSSTDEERYGGRGGDAAPTSSTDEERYGGRGGDAAPTSSTDEERPYHYGREVEKAPTSSTEEERLYGGRGADTAPTSSTDEERLYGGRRAGAEPTSSTDEERLYGGRGTGSAPTSSMDEERLYGGRGAGAAPTSSMDEERLYGGRGTGSAPTSSMDEDRPYGDREVDAAPTSPMDERLDGGRGAGAAPTSSSEEDRAYGGRGAGAPPTSSMEEDRPYGVREDGTNNNTDVTRYQGNPTPDTVPTVNGLCHLQDSSKATANTNFISKGECFLRKAPDESDYDAVKPLLCHNTLSGARSNDCSVSAAAPSSSLPVWESKKSVSDQFSRGTQISLSPDVVAGISAYLSSNLSLELANCGISSITSLIDSTDKANCLDIPCGTFILTEASIGVSENLIETKPTNSDRRRSSSPLNACSGQCNGVATFYHDQSNYFTKHNCDSDLMQITATDLMQDTATDLMQSTATNLIQGTANDLIQGTATDLMQSTATNLMQSTATNLMQGTATDLMQSTATDLMQSTATDLMQDTATDLMQDTATDLMQGTATDLMQGTATDLMQGTATDLMQGTATDLMQGTATDLMQGTATDLMQGTATDLMQGTATDLMQGTATDLMQGTATDLMQGTATDLMQGTATDLIQGTTTNLMHNTTNMNGLPVISNDNPCSSRLKSSLANGVSQSLGASSSASFDTVKDKASALLEENEIVPTHFDYNSVGSLEERIRPNDSHTPPLAVVRPREILEEVPERHVEEIGGADEEGVEYESCLTRLTLGKHLCTSRGLVPLSLLQPSATYESTVLFATDEGSRIGLLYLPQEDGYAEMHYIINGEDQGVFTRLLPYKRAPLHAVVDVYGSTKRVRIVQLYGVVSLKSACRATILQHLAPNSVSLLPLPPQLQQYLLGDGFSYR